MRSKGSQVTLVCVVALAAGVLVACGQDSQNTGADAVTSGVRGVAMVDGGCPPARDRSPCPDRPIVARLTVTQRDSGTTVARATTTADGRFTIPLRPGSYELRAANTTGAPVPLAPSQSITVVSGRYTEVKVAFDSGVR